MTKRTVGPALLAGAMAAALVVAVGQAQIRPSGSASGTAARAARTPHSAPASAPRSAPASSQSADSPEGLRALCRSAPAKAIDLMSQWMADHDQAHAAMAVETLVALHDKEFAPVLAKAFEDRRSADVPTLFKAAQTLARLDPDLALKTFPAVTLMDDSDGWGGPTAATFGLSLVGGDKAVDSLIDALKSGSPTVKHSAVRCLASLHATRAIDAFIAALSDPDDRVRYAAALGLGLLGDKRAVQPLTELAKSDPQPGVRGMAQDSLEAVERRGTAASRPTSGAFAAKRLVPASSRPGTPAIGGAKYGLVAASRSAGEFMSLLADLSAPDRRLDAVERLGRLRDPRAAAPLVAMLPKATDVELRRAIAKAMGRIGDPRSFDALAAALEEPQVKTASAPAASAPSKSAASAPSKSAALLFSDRATMVIIVEAMSRCDKARTREALIAMLDVKSVGADKATFAAEMLPTYGDAKAVPALAKIVDEQQSAGELFRRAAIALCRLDSARGAATLEPIVMNQQTKTVTLSSACMALARAIGESASAADRVLKDGPVAARIAMAKAIGDAAVTRHVEALIAALKDPEAKVRSAVVTALSDMGGADAIKPLEAVSTGDTDASVRKLAVAAVARIRRHMAAASAPASAPAAPAAPRP